MVAYVESRKRLLPCTHSLVQSSRINLLLRNDIDSNHIGMHANDRPQARKSVRGHIEVLFALMTYTS